MAGLYIHIPFCRKICSYCDFYKTPALSLIPLFLKALEKEMHERAGYLDGEMVETIYFGGGTPSLLTISQMEHVFRHIHTCFKVADNCEITVEANPDDLLPEYLKALHDSTPVNRLSIGIQSFHDRDLTLLNRRHNSQQALICVQNAWGSGFTNLTIDLIYGLPGMDLKNWEFNLNTAFSMNIQHLSAYHLTVEPRTALSGMVSRGLINLPEDTAGAEQFMMLHNLAQRHGFRHYEISNLAMEGFMSEHNSHYWEQKKYLGLGPSAHSYDLYSRQWNISNLKKYADAVQAGNPYFESEILDTTNRFNEYLMLSLRTDRGIKFSMVSDVYGHSYLEHLEKSLKSIRNRQWIELESDTLKLTPEGWIVSDYIVSHLMAG